MLNHAFSPKDENTKIQPMKDGLIFHDLSMTQDTLCIVNLYFGTQGTQYGFPLDSHQKEREAVRAVAIVSPSESLSWHRHFKKPMSHAFVLVGP